LCPNKTGFKAIDMLVRFLFEMYTLIFLGRKHSGIQVRDKIITGTLALWIAKLYKKPFFYWMSYPFPEEDLQNCKYNKASFGLLRLLFLTVRGNLTRYLLRKVLLPCASHVFVQSENMLSGLVSQGVPRHLMTAVPMCVDLDEYQNIDETVSIDDRLLGRRVVGYLGGLDRIRGLDFLLTSFALLHKKMPLSILLLIGDSHNNSDTDWLKQKAKELEIENDVIFTGWLPRQSAQVMLQSAEIGVNTIPNNTVFNWSSPTKVVEYAVLGIPSVVTDNPSQSQFIEESGAGICVEYDEVKFANALQEIFSKTELVKEMSANGKNFVAKSRNYKTISEEISSVYCSYALT